MQNPEQSSAVTEANEADDRQQYEAPDIDSAAGELMQTIRGTGGACDVATTGMEDGCSTN